MDEILISVLENNDFLKPYLKQFAKYFNDTSKLIEISPKSNKHIEYLKSLNIILFIITISIFCRFPFFNFSM